MLLQVYLWYLREDAQPLPVTPGGEASLSQRAEKACRLLADLKYRRTESDDRRRFIATTLESESSTGSSSSSGSSSSDGSSSSSSSTGETPDASKAASLAKRHAEEVAETAQAEVVAGAKKAADAIAAVEVAKQAMSAANTALQEALIHDGDLDAAQQSMTVAIAQHTAAKADVEKRKAGLVRLKEAAARVGAAPSSSSSLLSAPLSPGSRRLTRSLARSAASASATRSFFHACRLYDPDQQLRRVEVEECSKVRCSDGDGPQVSQDSSNDAAEDREDAAFLRFKKCSSFVRLRMDALSAAADESFLPPEDPTLNPDGAGLLSIGSNRKLWLPSEDRLLLRALTQSGSKAQEHWLNTGALPFNLIASEVLAATKSSEEVKARVESFDADHPVKKALEHLKNMRAYNEKVRLHGLDNCCLSLCPSCVDKSVYFLWDHQALMTLLLTHYKHVLPR